MHQNRVISYPSFGSAITDMQYVNDTNRSYRYGFNGMERTDELQNGDEYTTEYRQYDARLGRWFSTDPEEKSLIDLNPYNAMNNSPVFFSDPKGDFVIAGVVGFFKGLFRNSSNFQYQGLSNGEHAGESMFRKRIREASNESIHSMANSINITLGVFAGDGRKGGFRAATRFISRLTWELPQTIYGLLTGYATNLFFDVKSVGYKRGLTVLELNGNNNISFVSGHVLITTSHEFRYKTDADPGLGIANEHYFVGQSSLSSRLGPLFIFAQIIEGMGALFKTTTFVDRMITQRGHYVWQHYIHKLRRDGVTPLPNGVRKRLGELGNRGGFILGPVLKKVYENAK